MRRTPEKAAKKRKIKINDLTAKKSVRGGQLTKTDQFEQTFSNMLKSMEDSTSAIVQNIKG